MPQIVLYFLHITLVVSFYIDIVLTLFIDGLVEDCSNSITAVLQHAIDIVLHSISLIMGLILFEWHFCMILM